MKMAVENITYQIPITKTQRRSEETDAGNLKKRLHGDTSNTTRVYGRYIELVLWFLWFINQLLNFWEGTTLYDAVYESQWG
jgi:hypothetical protein